MFRQIEITRIVAGEGVNRLLCLDGSVAQPVLEEYAGQVQAVYLDPPFMTGERFTRRRKFGAEDWASAKGRPGPTYTGYSDQFETRGQYLHLLRGFLSNAKKLLTPSGVVMLHLDWRSCAHARLLCDEIFGEENFLNEIIWAYQSGGRAERHFSRKHDNILLYARDAAQCRFSLEKVALPPSGKPNSHLKRRVDEDGRAYRVAVVRGKEYRYYEDAPTYPTDVWTDLSHLQQHDPERTGWPSQKPLSLLTRLLKPFVEAGDTVADLCCGSGTSLAAAAALGCRYLGLDNSPEAISVCQNRLPPDDLIVEAPCSAEPAGLHGTCDPGGGVLTLAGFDAAHKAFPRDFEPLSNLEGYCLGTLDGDGTLRVEVTQRRSFRVPQLAQIATFPPTEGPVALLTVDAAGQRRGYVWTDGQDQNAISKNNTEADSMKATFSPYLAAQADALKRLIALLRERYDYVSVLATDSTGFSVRVSQRSKSVGSETLMTERGVVVRVCKNGHYAEAAFNGFDPSDPEAACRQVCAELDAQQAVLEAVGSEVYTTPLLPDEPQQLFVEMDTGRLPGEEDIPALIQRLSAVSDKGMAEGRDWIECGVSASCTHVSKMFLTEHRDLRQSYCMAEGSVFAMGHRGDRTETAHQGISGRCGPELFEHLEELLPKVREAMEDVLGSERIVPGEYEIITSPEVTGLIAHEAFGHGVEMDMFVKERALGAKYIGKRVGSDRVTMHEGALCAEDVASYAFDDEGTLAGDVVEIERGILKTGVCDALSALRLGTAATGNGKRENFAHKVYTRMTNTLFDSGSDTLEDMIASIQKGYLLAGMNSGMEDPKHWGIQCIVDRGYEIVDGKLTGKVVSPVVMTGYVPDLLGSISMLTADRCVFGNGACGKGYKEWVKVTDGGPYMKAKARLG